MNNLSKLRGKHQLSMVELARKIGITKQGLYFNETHKCSPAVAKKVAEALGENVFDVLGVDALVVKPQTEAEKEALINIIKGL